MPRHGKRKEFDILIIGTGISGLTAAYWLSEAGYEVAVISKDANLSECNTQYAQGGIVFKHEHDSPGLLQKDIIAAGCAINFDNAVKAVAEEGPALVQDFLIDRVSVPFCRDNENNLEFTQEGAHSVRRIIHVKDKTGAAIEKSLLDATLNKKHITFFPAHTAVELITSSHNSMNPQDRYQKTRVIGAYVLNAKTESVDVFIAGAVVLATGGVGHLFLHTSNTVGATGDGVAMACRIGAEIINAEYIQFHPTILYHRDVKRFLITEALRGEGARLKNRDNEFFMRKYHGKLADLAPRDEVSRAIFYEMEKTDSEYVLLDTQEIKSLSLHERFPAIYAQCKELGIDIEKEPVPVVPAAHYFCGGIKVDLCGRTNISGLFAVGENSCTGVHGANRLASVSLLEGLLWGKKTALAISDAIQPVSQKLIKNIPEWIFPLNEEVFDPVLILQDMVNVRTTMWNYAGIVRNKNRLSRALADLNYLSHRIEKFYKQAKITRRIIELRNAVLTSLLIVRAASANKTSCGCHFIEE
ncbi:MAG: L-aspartate oxidase [Spirochaetales bacterium]|nr:L-aspartate oxidase [Spirochaetales bacterium]